MARVPIPGQDADSWGLLLNNFLQVSHNEDGTLKNIQSVANVQDYLDRGQSIQTAIDSVQSVQGGIVFFPAGTYIIDAPLSVAADNVRLVGESRSTILMAGQDNQTLIHFAASHGSIENLTLHGNGHSNVWAIQMAPKNQASAMLVKQNYNRVSNIFIQGCQEGRKALFYRRGLKLMEPTLVVGTICSTIFSLSIPPEAFG